MVGVDALESWWERLPPARRGELIRLRHSPLRPDLALELWQDSGWLPVVRPGRWSDDANRLAWRFAPEVEEFLAQHAAQQDAVDVSVAREERVADHRVHEVSPGDRVDLTR
jgi:hypothetical protein